MNAAYYPVELVKTAELDPKKNHLISCHPHGILCFGAVVRDFVRLSFDLLFIFQTDGLCLGFVWTFEPLPWHYNKDLYPSG